MLKNLALLLGFGVLAGAIFSILPESLGQVRQAVFYALGLAALAGLAWRRGRQRK